MLVRVHAALVQRLAQVVLPQHLERPGVHDLQPPLLLGGVGLRLVQRAVDHADAGVQDPAPAVDEDALVRGAAGGEPTELLAVADAEHVHHVGRRRAHHDPPTVRGHRHVVRAVARDGEAPHDPAGPQADRDDVGEGRPGHDEPPPVAGGVHVVDELVVPLTDLLLDREVVRRPHRIGGDLRHPLLAVRDDVDPPEALERAGSEHVGRPVPVVADEDRPTYVAQRCRALGGAGRRRAEGDEEHAGHDGQQGADDRVGARHGGTTLPMQDPCRQRRHGRRGYARGRLGPRGFRGCRGRTRPAG